MSDYYKQIGRLIIKRSILIKEFDDARERNDIKAMEELLHRIKFIDETIKNMRIKHNLKHYKLS